MLNFGTKSDNTAGPSGQLSADEFNNLASELENSVARSGLALDGLSITQLAMSLFIHAVKSQAFQDSGAANAYVATPVSGSGGVLLPSNYTNLNGALIAFVAAASNTGASTLNIGQTTGTLLGTKVILNENGSALTANNIIAGEIITVRFNSALDSGNGAWVLVRVRSATETAPGIMEIADTAESQAWADAFRALTPLRLNTAFQGSNQLLATNGFQKVPGGWIVQWGVENVPTGGAGSLFNLALAFPNASYIVVGSHFGASGGSLNAEAITSGLTQVRLTHSSGASANVAYIAIGR